MLKAFLSAGLLVSILLVSAVSQGHQARVVPADEMSCAQAVAYYEKYKRIYVVGNAPHDIVPIYGMKPKSRWREVQCSGRGQGLRAYWVNTLDEKRCVIAYRCG